MQINHLVYIGVLFILLNVGLNVYLQFDRVRDTLKRQEKNHEFEEETKEVLDKVDKIVEQELHHPTDEKDSEELERIDAEINELKKELEEEPEKEVFLVHNNIFEKDAGEKVCKNVFNSELATKKQVEDGFNNGANWCNYGWTSEGEAYYPLQDKTDGEKCAGDRGLNGGELDGDNLKLGVHCYGVKPKENDLYSLDKLYSDSHLAEEDQKILDTYRKRLHNKDLKVAPFNNKSWSQYSHKNDTIHINETLVVSSKKDTSKDPNSIKVEKFKVQEIAP